MFWFGKERNEQIQRLHFARDWAKRNEGIFLQIMHDIGRETLSTLQPLMEDGLLYNLSHPDPHSRPFCHAFVERYPDAKLEGGIAKRIHGRILYPKHPQLYTEVYHSYFTFDDIRIDYTFGQFYTLDHVILLHRNLFQGRILVASEVSLKRALDIEYL